LAKSVGEVPVVIKKVLQIEVAGTIVHGTGFVNSTGRSAGRSAPKP
jgi:hypothetical protein